MIALPYSARSSNWPTGCTRAMIRSARPISEHAGDVGACVPSWPIARAMYEVLPLATTAASLVRQQPAQRRRGVPHETAHVTPVLNFFQRATRNAVGAEPQNVSAGVTHQNR